jgi:hypothetical protein
MAIPHWNPPRDITRQEHFILKRLKSHKLFVFLRQHRAELFDEAFQCELDAMYRDTGAGKDPKPPAMLAMATLLQAYSGVSDEQAVELSVVDLRWQMVLACIGATEPPFEQGTLFNFRQRMIRHDMDRRLLERTCELAKSSREFDWRKLPKTLRVAIDSAPLEGAGRVEDTINLLGHAARKVVECAAVILGWKAERVCREADIPVLQGSSVKAALDVQWSDPAEKVRALETLIEQLDHLEAWLTKQLPDEIQNPPLSETLETLRQLRAQDIEPDPDPKGSSKPRIRQGTAPDRRISIEDPDMRHGRKSKSKLFNGYKRHVALDLDGEMILACAVEPANRPEQDAVPALRADLDRQGLRPDALFIDRGYVGCSLVDDVLARRGQVVCRPWVSHNGDLFPKEAFRINLRDHTVACPAGHRQPFELDSVVEFDKNLCGLCTMRAQCTAATGRHGRMLRIAADELFQERLRRQAATSDGRARLRERTAIEHSLAHVVRRQGHRARYKGTRKNLYDMRRAATVVNLETLDRHARAVEERRAA